MDPILAVWNSLRNENQQVLEVENNSFDYPDKKPYVMGIFKNDLSQNGQMRFMSFNVAMHIFSQEALEDTQRVIITFYQIPTGRWVFSMSSNPTRATFSQPMACCEHAAMLAGNLAKNEEGELHVRNADGEKILVLLRPFELVLN